MSPGVHRPSYVLFLFLTILPQSACACVWVLAFLIISFPIPQILLIAQFSQPAIFLFVSILFIVALSAIFLLFSVHVYWYKRPF